MERTPLLPESPSRGPSFYGYVTPGNEYASLMNERVGGSRLKSSRSVPADARLQEPDDSRDAASHSNARPSSTPARERHKDDSDDSHDGALAEASDDVVAGAQESGLESHFTAAAGLPADLAMGELKHRASNRPGAADSPTLQIPTNPISDDIDEELTPVATASDNPIDNSPYPQVRASVPATDDLSLSINTPRMWVLAITFAVLGSATNLFFSLRYPSVSITPVIALLLVHPLGRLWDVVLKKSEDPEETFVMGNPDRRDPFLSDLQSNGDATSAVSNDTQPHQAQKAPRSRAETFRLWLAQGRWNEKEHACVYISSNVSFGFAFATDVIVEQTKFYKQDVTITYQLLLIISTQVLGYAAAGLTRRYLVRPSGMIWPATLISTAMFTTLHREENRPADGWRISRWKFFLVVFFGSFAWYFLPGLLMPSLSFFNVITWFAPRNVPVANLFGVSSGLGMFPLTFDWSQIAYTGSPLVVPFWAAMNVAFGLVVVMWLAAPIMYYANVLFGSYMPIVSASVFDNTGNVYDVSRILTTDFVFDQESYQNYSQVFLPITYVLSYAAQFASITALLVHTALWHGKSIVGQWKSSLKEARAPDSGIYQQIPTNGHSSRYKPRASRSMDQSQPDLEQMMYAEDVHNRLMRNYEDVPMMWYLLTGVAMLAIGMFIVEYYPVHLPWYGLLLAFGICAILFIPIGIVMAITSQQSSIYLLCQLVCGFLFPGRPVANMLFVVFGYITSTQGLKFSADLKLGHYMKIPPKLLFGVQMVATIVASVTQIGVLNWMFANIEGICTAQAISGFTCPLARVHFNGSILWGVLGPGRFLGRDGMYKSLLWAFPFGAVAPVVIWWLAKRDYKSIWRKVNLPVILGSLSWIPPATGLNFSVWWVVCFVFNYVIKNKKTRWWKKYNMTMSAALDAGVAFGVAVVFFGLVYPGFTKGFSWWGTEVYKQGCDWQACPYREVPAGQHFGPDEW